MVYLENLDEVVEKIQALEVKKIELAKFLRKRGGLTWSVGKVELGDMKIGGEDGGITKKTTHLVDFVFLRAISVIFDYKGGKLCNVEYYPSPNPNPETFHSTEPISEAEFSIFWSLKRLKKELGVSIETIKKFAPAVFLIDGSLMIHPGDVPKKESTLYEDYMEVKGKIAELYELGRKNNCLIAGVVEDSRSSTFCNLLESEQSLGESGKDLSKQQRELLSRTKDTNLLYYLLEKGEATREIDCGEGIKCVYMKTAEFDRPIRVEYQEGNREKIANIIFTLSCESRTYGLPNVLIEADQRAKLSETDSEYYMNHIASRLGIHDVFFLRRENRPF